MSNLSTHPHVFLPTRLTGCQGYAKGTKKQCGFRIGRDQRFCHNHAMQEGKCRAITRNEKRCLGSITSDGRDFFCKKHEDWATPNERVCEGVKPSDGLKCSRRATDPNYPFCMTQHDKRANYCDPQMFRQDGLRNQMLETLRKRDKNHDRYNPGRKTSTRASSDEVDHIGECQTAAMCCQFATFTNDEEKHDVVKFFSGNLVNESRNFLVTSAVTNQRKGQGTTHFQQDLMKFSLSQYGEPNSQALDDIREASFNVPIVATYNDRLLEQGLSRASTRAIRRESGQALQYWKYKCLDEGDSPIYDVLGKLVGKIFVVFDLHIDADLD